MCKIDGVAKSMAYIKGEGLHSTKILEFCRLSVILFPWYCGDGKRRERGTIMITFEEQICIFREDTCRMLHELRIGIHRNGYKQLVILIPCYALDNTQSLSKELYPYVADHFGYASWYPVEHAVRIAILDAWERREPEVWEKYFPGLKKPPSNKQFIATLAERLKNSPPGNGRG